MEENAPNEKLPKSIEIEGSTVEEAIKLLQDAEGVFTVRQCNCNAYIRGCDRDKARTASTYLPIPKFLIPPLTAASAK